MTLTGKDLEEEMDGFQRQGQIAGEKRLGRPELGVDVSNLTQASITAAFWNAKILVAMQSPGQFRANGIGTRTHWTHASKIIPLSLQEKDGWHRQQPVGGRWWTWGIRMDSKDYELWCLGEVPKMWRAGSLCSTSSRHGCLRVRNPQLDRTLLLPDIFQWGYAIWNRFPAVFNIHSTVLNWRDQPKRKTTCQRSERINGYRKRTRDILIF